MDSTDRTDARDRVTIELPPEHSAIVAGEIWSELEIELEGPVYTMRSAEDIDRVRAILDRYSAVIEQVPADPTEPMRISGPREMFGRIAAILFDHGADNIIHADGSPESQERAYAMADAARHIQIGTLIVDQLRAQQHGN